VADLASCGTDAKAVLADLFPDQHRLAEALGSAVIRAHAWPGTRVTNRKQRLVAGMLPVPVVPMSDELRQALETRAKLIIDRAN
jgi:hypothetical protein